QVTGKALYDTRPGVHADAARRTLADRSVDAVVLLEVLELLHRPREALAEAARVLKAGSKQILAILLHYPVHGAPHDYQRYTTFGLVRALRAAGFLVDEERVRPGLDTTETAGLVACLVLGGTVMESLVRW